MSDLCFSAPGLQVPISSVCWGYLLLLCWHDLCCGGDLGTLQQNNAAFFHPTSTQLPLFIASTLPRHSLSPSPATEVMYQVTYSGTTGCVFYLQHQLRKVVEGALLKSRQSMLSLLKDSCQLQSDHTVEVSQRSALF